MLREWVGWTRQSSRTEIRARALTEGSGAEAVPFPLTQIRTTYVKDHISPGFCVEVSVVFLGLLSDKVHVQVLVLPLSLGETPYNVPNYQESYNGRGGAVNQPLQLGGTFKRVFSTPPSPRHSVHPFSFSSQSYKKPLHALCKSPNSHHAPQHTRTKMLTPTALD